MITDIEEFLQRYPQISGEIPVETIDNALYDTEYFIVKDRIGDDMYVSILENPEQYYNVINGGTIPSDSVEVRHIAGLKSAIYHLAYASLISNNTKATVFGAVITKDDYSQNAGNETIDRECRYHWTIGYAWLEEVMDILGVNGKRSNNDYFNEYL